MKGKKLVIIIIQFHKLQKISRKVDNFQRILNDFYGV
jgi:hypothetical protein